MSILNICFQVAQNILNNSQIVVLVDLDKNCWIKRRKEKDDDKFASGKKDKSDTRLQKKIILNLLVGFMLPLKWFEIIKT